MRYCEICRIEPDLNHAGNFLHKSEWVHQDRDFLLMVERILRESCAEANAAQIQDGTAVSISFISKFGKTSEGEYAVWIEHGNVPEPLVKELDAQVHYAFVTGELARRKKENQE